MMYQIKVPTVIYLPKKTKPDKRYPLNLNHFRNAHYTENNNAKKQYKAMIVPDLLPISNGKIKIRYGLVLAQQRGDVANVCAIVDKFFCDALVELGYIADDDYKTVVAVEYYFMGIDKSNPHCLVTIEEV